MGRKKKDDSIPDNLYPTTINGTVYYIFRHPQTGKPKSLGKDKKAAASLAILLNDALLQQGITARVPQVQKKKTLGYTLDKFYREKIKKIKTARHAYTQGNFIKRINAEFGKRNINSIKTADLYQWLEPMPGHSYHKLKSVLVEFFAFAISTGALDGINPAKQLLHKSEPKRKRRRLSKENYNAIYRLASNELQLLMTVMLNTTLRPQDATLLKKSQYNNGVLSVLTKKTGVLIQYELSSEAIADIITRSNSTNILSEFIVHRMPKRIRSRDKWPAWRTHHTQCGQEELSKEFSRIRDSLGIFADIPAKERPSLYEVRSAAGRWMKAAGVDEGVIQALYGHTENDTTQLYLDSDEIKVFKVKAGQRV